MKETGKEVTYVILAALVIGYVIAFPFNWYGWLVMSCMALVMLFFHHIAHKLAALKLGCSAEIDLVSMKRYWFYEKAYWKKSLPLWLILPLLLVWLGLGWKWWIAVPGWLALTAINITAGKSRVARRFAELTEFDICIIAAAGITANIFLAIIASFAGLQQFAMLNLWFCFFNLLPLGSLDGMKILMGETLLWIFIFCFVIIMLILLNIATLLTTVLSAIILAIIAALVFYGLRERPK